MKIAMKAIVSAAILALAGLAYAQQTKEPTSPPGGTAATTPSEQPQIAQAPGSSAGGSTTERSAAGSAPGGTTGEQTAQAPSSPGGALGSSAGAETTGGAAPGGGEQAAKAPRGDRN